MKMNPDFTHKGIVFISYSTKDQRFASDLYEVLNEQNVDCFLASEDLMASVNWITELTRQLKKSWLVLLLVTPSSTRSIYVLRELNVAVSKDIPIYPVLLKPTNLSDEIEFLISVHQITDVSEMNWPEPVQLILNTVQALYQKRTSEPHLKEVIQSRDKVIVIDRNMLPSFVQMFNWIELDIPEEVETATKSLPLPDPIQENVSPEAWIQSFRAPFDSLLVHEGTKRWLQDHFKKLAFGLRGLTSFVLLDAVLSVPPLARVFEPITEQLERSWRAMLFAPTGTGKSRLLTYLAHYWRKKYDRPVFFIEHPQGVTTAQWEAWSETIGKITDRNTMYPILIFIEDLHTIPISARASIESFIQTASQTTYAVFCTYTVLEKGDEQEKQEINHWKTIIHRGMERQEEFESYWKTWQPYFFDYMKWMAPAILEKRIPYRWTSKGQFLGSEGWYTLKEKIFQTYKSPWSFLVGLGYLEEAFEDEFLSKGSDPLNKAVYLFLHFLFLLKRERPIRVLSFLNFLRKGLKNYISEQKFNGLEAIITELFQDWSSHDKRLLPPSEILHIAFEQYHLQPVYHQEWANLVIQRLYKENPDSDFQNTVESVLKKIYTDEYEVWEQLNYETKSPFFLQWLIETIELGEQEELYSAHSLKLRSKKLTQLPESIGKLKSLIYLDASYNQIRKLPKSLCNLSLLKELHLYANNLSKLPKCIGNLKSLQTLGLGLNKLMILPESFWNLKSLQKLSLSENKLTTLSKSIGNLISLETLKIFDNKINALPETICNLRTLQDLWIYKNPLNYDAALVLSQLRQKGVNVVKFAQIWAETS